MQKQCGLTEERIKSGKREDLRESERKKEKERNSEGKNEENTLCLITDLFFFQSIVEVDSVPLTVGDVNY